MYIRPAAAAESDGGHKIEEGGCGLAEEQRNRTSLHPFCFLVAMNKKVIWILVVTVLAIAIALGIGLGVGLNQDHRHERYTLSPDKLGAILTSIAQASKASTPL